MRRLIMGTLATLLIVLSLSTMAAASQPVIWVNGSPRSGASTMSQPPVWVD